MSWLNPWMLLGIAGIAVPVLIHLVRREAQQGQLFPSLMFVRKIPYKTRERKTLRNPWLLAVRSALIALLVLALAGPYIVEQPNESETLQSGRDVVLAVDRSFSMEYGDRWRQALEIAHEQIGQLISGDRVALILFDQFAELAVPMTSNHSSLAAVLDNAEPGDRGTRYGPVLRRVESLLSDSLAESREFILIGDLQAGSESTLRLHDDIAITVIPVSGAQGSNLSLISANVRDKSNSDTRKAVEARVRNTGSESASTALRFVVDNRTLDERSLTLEPGEETTLNFELLVSENRNTALALQIDSDDIEADNVIRLVVSAAPRIRTLLVDSVKGSSDTSVFVEEALRLSTQPVAEITRISLGELDAISFADVELIVLLDTSLPEGDEAISLARFVNDGGALLVVGINQAPEEWPSQLADVLPGSGVQKNIEIGTRGIQISALDHPATRAFAEDSGMELSDAIVYRHRKLIEKPGDTVLGRLDDQSPFLVARESGAGRVLLFAAAPSMPQSNLGMNPGFAPLVLESLRFLAREPARIAANIVGTPIDLRELVSGRAGGSTVAKVLESGQNVSIESPDGKVHPVRKSRIYLPEHSGWYQLRAGAAASLSFAVNIDPAETQFAGADVEPWLADIVRVPTRPNVAATSNVTESSSSRLWWYILVIALAAAVLELLLGNTIDRTRPSAQGFAGA